MSDDSVSFLFREDHRQIWRPADPFHPRDVLEFAIEDLLVKEEEGAESLVLSGGGDVIVNGEVAQEGGDLFFAHLGGMALPVE
jgi:hypothetical protein